MTNLSIALRVTLGGTLFLTYAAYTAAGADRLPKPIEEAVVGASFADKPVPKWENGFLVGYDNDQVPPTVSVFDRAGHRVNEVAVTIPEADRVLLRDAVEAPNGVLAVAGSAIKQQGAAGAAFIAWIAPSGKTLRIIRTSPFAAIRLCFGPDGTLWAAGREFTADFLGEPPHDVLRHYDSEGLFLKSLLPRDSFGSTGGRHPTELAFLVASPDRVGFYTTRGREWIEISPSGALLGRWKGFEAPPPIKIRGVGLTPAGSVYISTDGNASRMTEYYQLDKKTGVWNQIDGANVVGSAQRFAHIVGSDGNSLVMRDRSLLFWVPVP